MAAFDFAKAVKTSLALRASYICSNPACHCLTLTLTGDDATKVVYRGRAVAVCGAEGGPRFEAGMTSNQRKAIGNAIFLCARCADSINRSKGVHYPAALLRSWKDQHKQWVRTHLNLRQEATAALKRVAATRASCTSVSLMPTMLHLADGPSSSSPCVCHRIVE